MGKSPFFDHKMGLNKGPWTPEEDQKLLAHIQQHGHGSWRSLPSKAGLQRCGKSCRLRWTNYLRPDIKRGKFSLHEEQTIIQLHALLGNRWSTIANHLPKRTDNEIKNYWNTHLKKKLTKMGIDPMTHKPKNHTFNICDGQATDVAKLSHMAQWESARLEAEARLVRQSRLGISFSSYTLHNENFLNKDPSHMPAQPLTLPPRPIPCLDVLKAWASINPRKNIPVNGFFDLQSQTSVFKFPEKLNHQNPSFEISNEGKDVDEKSDDQLIRGGMEGVTENSLMDSQLIHDEHHVITCSIDTMYVANDDTLGFPKFMEGFNSNDHVIRVSDSINAGFDQSGDSNTVEGCGGVFEENKDDSYWGSSPLLMLEEM